MATTSANMSLPQSKYSSNTEQKIPARSGIAVPLHLSQTLTVINKHGTQVVDFWYVTADLTSRLSMCHTRAVNLHLSPLPGDILVSNHRKPMLEFVSDTTPSGVHDTLIAACDLHRYHQLGVDPDAYHANCADNYRDALREDCSIILPDVLTTPPDPLNLFMNIPVTPHAAPLESDANDTKNVSAGSALAFEAPLCRPGDRVTLRALVPGIAVMSACPQDILKINNQDPTDAFFVVGDE